MATDIVQAFYENLTAIAGRFQAEADRIQEMQEMTQSAINPLQDGGWVGKGSNAFYQRMEGKVSPRVDRLISALAESNRVTMKIIDILKQAEDEASHPFRGESVFSALFGEPRRGRD